MVLSKAQAVEHPPGASGIAVAPQFFELLAELSVAVQFSLVGLGKICLQAAELLFPLFKMSKDRQPLFHNGAAGSKGKLLTLIADATALSHHHPAGAGF